MDCNKEEASRAMDLAVVKLQEADYAGAKRIALRAQKLFPGLENICQLLTVCEVHCCAALKINGVTDWYGILQVEKTADDMLLKKQYRKLALLLHPDKNKFVGAEAAFKLIGEAHMILTDKVHRSCHDLKWNLVIPKSAPMEHGRPSNKTDYANKENTDAGYSTFWTICLTCGSKYQYPRSSFMKFLWCQMCSKHFLAYDLSKKPFVGVEGLNPWSGFGMQHQMFPPSQWTHVANQQHNYQSVTTWQNFISGHQTPVPNQEQQPRNVFGKQTPDVNQQQRSQNFPFSSGPKNVVNSHAWSGSGMQQEMCPPNQPPHVFDQMFPPSQWTHVANQQQNYQNVPTWQNFLSGHQAPVPNQKQQTWHVSGKQTPDINQQHRSQQFPFCSGPNNVVNSHPWSGSGIQQEMCPPSQPTHVSDQKLYYERAPGQQNPVNGHQTPVPFSSGPNNVVNSHPWGGSGMQQETCPSSQPTHVSEQKLYYQRPPGQQNPVTGHQTLITDCQQQSLKVVDKNVVSSQGAAFLKNNATANSNLTAEAGACNREKITRPSFSDENGEDRTKSPVVNSDKVHLVNELMKEKEVATGSIHPVAINGVQVATEDVFTATSPNKTPRQHPCTASQQRNNVVEDGSDGCGKVSNHLPDSPAKKRMRKEHSSYTGAKIDHATENEVDEANSQHIYSIPSKAKVTNEKEVISLNHDADARSLNNSSPCSVTVSCPRSDLFVRSSNEAPFLIPSGNTLSFSDSIPFHRLAETNRQRIPNGALELDTASLPSGFFEGTLPSDLEKAFTPMILESSFVSTRDGNTQCNAPSTSSCQVPVGNTKQSQDGTGTNVKDEVEKLNRNTKIEPVNLDRNFVCTRDGNTQFNIPSTSSCQVPVGKSKQSQDGTGTNIKDEVEKLNQNRKIKPWFLRREGKTWRVAHSRATPRRT